MLVTGKAQKPIHLGGITGDNIHIWDPELEVIDRILDDDRFVEILFQSLRRAAPYTKNTGRKRMALNRILRTAALEHIETWSFPTLFEEMQRNLDDRAFTQFFEEKTPSVSTFSRNFARVDARAVRELNERLIQIALQRRVIQGRHYRQDTTVCETDIHYPTDSSSLQCASCSDGCAAQRNSPLCSDACGTAPSLYAIAASKSAGRHEGVARRRKSVASAPTAHCCAPPVATAAARVVRKLGERRVTRHLGWDGERELLANDLAEEIGAMLPRFEKVIRQTRVRVCQGIHDWPDEIFSLFVPTTCVIRKGKAHKPNEFGRLVDIVEVESGIVSDYQVLDGNPDDGSLLGPALERHEERFGKPPRLVATDRGFWSARNEREAYARGVERVSIPARGKVSRSRLRLQRSRWFRNAQRWRAAGEGRIGTLKNVFGMDRCK